MVKFQNVCGGYETQEVLHHIDLSFQPGKVTVIVGPNGCGKSTLLKSIIRLIHHTSGQISVDEINIENFETSQLAQKVTYLPQNKMPVDITVFRMVLHGRFPYLKYPRRYRKEDIEIAQKALEKMGIDHLADKNISQLSGGLQQKVYIAMALAQNTSVILMDEPMVYLDISHQIQLMDTARELADRGKTVVMVLHDLPQAFRKADEIVVMKEGEIVQCGIPEEIYKSGVIEQVFEVNLERMQTVNGWQYFYS